MQFGAKEHFLKAGILYLAKGDSVDCKIACDRYDSQDPRFASSREGKLFRALVEAHEQQDVEAFSSALKEFDSLSPIDSWKVHFLYNVKQQLGGGGGDHAANATASNVAGIAESSADIDLT
eukprot:Selendium_serpulae@DN4406_c0_g1_i1.p1